MTRTALSLMLLWLTAGIVVKAQNAVVEETAITVECDDMKHATARYKTVVTILNEHGADNAVFVCPCSK